MTCIDCGKENVEFPVINYKNGFAPYVSKRCKFCREIYEDKKRDKEKNIKTGVCTRCKSEFEITFNKNTQENNTKCPKCLKKHVNEEKASKQKKYTKKVEKHTSPILNDEFHINNIDKKELLNIIADKLIEKMSIK